MSTSFCRRMAVNSIKPAPRVRARPELPATLVAIADVNHDGKPDVVVANIAGSVSVLLGNGDGTFGTPMSTTVDQNANGLALGDFNGDGNLDVAVASYGQDTAADHGSVTILTGKGDGTFATSLVLTLNGLTPVAGCHSRPQWRRYPGSRRGDGNPAAGLAASLSGRRLL